MKHFKMPTLQIALRCLNKTSARWVYTNNGATAIEYGLIAAGIAMAIALIIFSFGDSVAGMFDYALEQFTSHGA